MPLCISTILDNRINNLNEGLTSGVKVVLEYIGLGYSISITCLTYYSSGST